MGRSHARILTSIWQDAEFRALGEAEQRMFFLALSQPGLSMCGVVSYTPKRWAKLAAGSTPGGVRKAVAGLAATRFVVVDEDTEELLIRTFAKNDGVLQSPNLVKAMWKAYGDVVSEPLRQAFVEGLPEPFREGLPERFRPGSGRGSPPCAQARAPLPQPPPQDPSPSPRVDDNPASSRRVVEGDGGDDETTEKVISDAFVILAQRNLERRNDDLQRRGQETITQPRRRRGWMATDIRTSEETLTKVARLYLEDQPHLSAQQLAEVLDDRIVAAAAASPLAGSA